ncbi:sugar transporter [Aspergillus eucalypticola CBS 122712]|uniref:Sugar transporter n=1 Tax=Aspergillus eucalypticola (strain CBS 122712 / IBT 29274) TaxID=1448314 RepID=A0A317ULK0_ASPEC|nr:sugar transporter [Aspergillus eucalypticola CBS 122712]PWY62068.1 sugar transporter [Aspergillus eucalypticola CBS 122712]
MTKKEHPEELDKSSAVHDEHADTNAPALLSSEVKYDAGKLRDLIQNPYPFGAAFLASFGGFSFGYDQGVISIILQSPETSPDHAHYGFNVGLMTGMLELGAFIGAAIQTAAQNHATTVAGRFIRGIGVGTLAMGAPLYIYEISPPAWRGSFLVLEAISIVIGAVVSYWITYGTRSIPNAWAPHCGLSIHPFPFSPRWLAMRGWDQDSLGCLAKLRGRSPQDEKVQLEWKGILSEVRFHQALLEREYPDHARHPLFVGFKQWVDIFRPRYLRRTLQFSGINAFVYYAPTFFEALGQSDNNSLTLSGMVNVCQFIGGVPIMLYLDKVGRRKLAIYGGIAMAIPHLVMAGLMNQFSSDWATHQAVGWFCVALICKLSTSNASAHLPLIRVFPSSKRAKGVGAATGMIWLANFIIGVVVPEMLLKLGWGTYLFFGIFCVAAAVFSFFLVPETSNKSLEQVAAVFGDELIDEERNLQSRIAGEVWHGYGSHAEKEARV